MYIININIDLSFANSNKIGVASSILNFILKDAIDPQVRILMYSVNRNKNKLASRDGIVRRRACNVMWMSHTKTKV